MKKQKTQPTVATAERNGGGGSAGNNTNQATAALPSVQTNEPESMKKLRALKEKINNELQHEQKERVDFEHRDVVIPISLSNDYATSSNKRGANKSTKQQVEKLVALTKEKISGLKQLDKHMQRELEVELEKRAVETTQLKAHNQRLREIIALRQGCNTRREEKFENEVLRIKDLTDEMCVDAMNYQSTMAELREMNQQVQDGAVQMKTHIEEQAETERLALIRTYRVRMREVKQQLKLQEAANLEGASAWIKRFNILDADRQTAEANLKSLKQKIELLTTDNSELVVMRRHQEEQRNALAQKIAILKRENGRFEAHIQRLESQMINSISAEEKLHSAPVTPVRLLQSRSGTRSRSGKFDSIDKKQSKALDNVRKTLDDMRQSLRKVRSAHVELLQERTELEMFVRQCIEDVRRDMYRYTVVNNITRSMNGNQWEEQAMLEDYGVDERKKLLNILNSKLQVLTLLLDKTFPGRLIAGDEPLGEYLKKHVDNLGDDGNAPNSVSTSPRVVPVSHEMDELWSRWKEWTRSVTPH